MKSFFFISILLSIFTANLFAQGMQVKYQDVSQAKMQEQNKEIASMAAKELSKNLPQKIDQFTTLQSIQNKDTTLLYTFLINDPKKSDEAIRKQDHSRMKKVVVDGICKTSKRFLQAGINISYTYLSAKSKKELFKFDVTKEKCNYPVPR
jgi:hypothetical protein